MTQTSSWRRLRHTSARSVVARTGGNARRRQLTTDSRVPSQPLGSPRSPSSRVALRLRVWCRLLDLVDQALELVDLVAKRSFAVASESYPRARALSFVSLLDHDQPG